MSKTFRLSGILGNILEHYDNALFGLLAPFIAPLFFDDRDPLTGLILTYGMMPLGMLARPLGSLVLGWVGDRWGRRHALFYSLLGMAVVTVGIGLLPTYQMIGLYAPLLLALCRMLQSFFMAGETSGGAIMLLEGTKSARHSIVSGLYNASSLGGVLIASGLITLFHADIQSCWRFFFWGGGAAAIIGFSLRLRRYVEAPPLQKVSWIQTLIAQKRALFCIALAAGFSAMIYSSAFTLMTGLAPLVTSLTKGDVLRINTALLLFAMLLLPCFGLLAYKFGSRRVMLFGALGSMLFAIPLFSFLGGASLGGLVLVQSILMIFDVAFAAPYYAWAVEEVPPECRYTVLSLGAALGTQSIGASTTMICLWLYQVTHSCFALALYLTFFAGAVCFVIRGRVAQKYSSVS